MYKELINAYFAQDIETGDVHLLIGNGNNVSDLTDNLMRAMPYGSARAHGIVRIGTGLSVTDGIISAIPSMRKYCVNNPELYETAGVCTWEIGHNLHTQDVCCSVYRLDTGVRVEATILVTSDDTLKISLASVNTIAADVYRAIIMG